MPSSAIIKTEITDSLFGSAPVTRFEFDVRLRLENDVTVKSRIYVRLRPEMTEAKGELDALSEGFVDVGILGFSERRIREHFRPWFKGDQLHPIDLETEKAFRDKLKSHCAACGYDFLMFQNMGYVH